MSIAAPRTPEEIKMAEISDSSYQAGWNEAIEECAQKIEQCSRSLVCATAKAALAEAAEAIRALEDKP